MRFTLIFGVVGIFYAMLWHQQLLIPPTNIFIPIATGALIDILILLSIPKHSNVKGEEIERVSNDEIERELENYLKG